MPPVSSAVFAGTAQHTWYTLLQEKQAQLDEISQKVDSLQMVEQWQRVQESYNRVIVWQTVRLSTSATCIISMVACLTHKCLVL